MSELTSQPVNQSTTTGNPQSEIRNPQSATPIALAIRPERVHPRYLVAGRAPVVEAVSIAALEPGRRYALSGLPWPVRVRLISGRQPEDLDRLRRIAEDLLGVVEPDDAPDALPIGNRK